MKIGASGQGGMADGMALFFLGSRAQRAKLLFLAILGFPLQFSWIKHKIYNL